MNSTSSGIKSFLNYYGEINPETMRQFFGLSKNSESFENLKRAWKKKLKEKDEGQKILKLDLK